MGLERVVFRVPRPLYAKESDPGPGFRLLREYKPAFGKRPQLDRRMARRLVELTEEQFQTRQVFIAKKQAKSERRIRAEGQAKERERIEFRRKIFSLGTRLER